MKLPGSWVILQVYDPFSAEMAVLMKITEKYTPPPLRPTPFLEADMKLDESEAHPTPPPAAVMKLGESAGTWSTYWWRWGSL
jgi:hypothetical protein